MDPETLAAMAKSYSYRLLRGETPTEARAYLRREFPFADVNAVRRAVYHAQRGIEVGNRLRELSEDQPLRAALGRMRPPHERVGVRVVIYIGRAVREGRTTREVEETISVYLDLHWDDPVSRVHDEVLRYVNEGRRNYGRATYFSWDYAGPTWWHAGYP